MTYVSAVFAMALLACARAQDTDAAATGVNQLETPRLTQAAQREEFRPEGETSAFKFSFADPVRLPLCFQRVTSAASVLGDVHAIRRAVLSPAMTSTLPQLRSPHSNAAG